MIGLDFKAAQGNFFDRDKVEKAVDRATFRVLKQFGRATRRRAQASLRYGERSSPPGVPPTIHKTGSRRTVSRSSGRVRVRRVSPLREFLYFAFEPERKSVVIGPAIYRAAQGRDVLPALEYGGRSVGLSGGKPVRRDIDPRPFMQPAAEAERENLPALWRDSVR